MNIQTLRRQLLSWGVTAIGVHAAVVTKFGLTPSEASYLSQVVNGYSFGEKSARNWETKLRLPAKFLDQELRAEQPRVGYMEFRPVAQPLNLSSFDDAPSVNWEAIMTTGSDLPVTFTCAVPDDALAPNTPRGTPVVFDAGNRHPPPGVGVLLEDKHGARYIRVYRAAVGGQWTAWARNPDYPSLESATHGLRILAVARHRMLDGTL